MDELCYPFDGGDIAANKKRIKKQLLSSGQDFLKKRIAILGGSTTREIRNILELFLLNEGIQPEFYESEYNRFYQDILFDNPELASFSPDIIYIYTTNRNISRYPCFEDSEETVQQLLDAEYNRLSSLWIHIKEKYGCPVIQNNFEQPLYRLLGNRDCYDIRGAGFFIHELNGRIYKFAQKNDWFYICDLNYISSDYGLREWQDPKYWYMYKYALPIGAVPSLSYNVCRIIKSIFGRNKKGLVLDLDNTLWGGVIGDDGVEGIEVGAETAEAEAYLEFQKYLKRMKDLGLLLCINSKNDLENAIAGLNHPDSVLKPEDFIEIRANWEDKDVNHRSIAASLGILPESLVFIDDNPAERDIVKFNIEGVSAPDIGDVTQYIQTIDRLGAFEMTVYSEDDRKRNGMYLANKKRKEQESAFKDYGEYLLSLEMCAEIRPFDPVHYSRISQLSNKSNQYNLTTRRYTWEEIHGIAEDDSYITLQGKLTDKFGDNGIVSLIIGKICGDVCRIDLWVMSCRVLKRDMEFAMMDMLAEKCGEKGIKQIEGVYLPSKKNGMVKDHYKKMGFLLKKEERDMCTWEMKLDGYRMQNHVIRIL